jgi:O-antigen ligase
MRFNAKLSAPGLPSLAAGLVTSVCVLFQWWMPFLAILLGVPATLFLVSEPFKALMMWLLVSPTLGSYIKLSLPSGIPDITFDRLVVGCILLALALRIMFRGGQFLPAGQTEKAMALFYMTGLLDVFFRSQTKGSDFLIFFDECGVPFLLFVVAKNLFQTDKQVQQFVRALFLVGVYLGFYGAYQFLAHGSIIAAHDYDPETLGHLLEGRAVGPFLNGAVYGTLLTYAFVWSLYLLSLERWGRAQFVIVIGLVLFGLGMFLSLTRAVWVGFFVALFVVQLFDRKWRKPFILCLVAASILVPSIAWFKKSDESLVRERLVAADSVYQRLASYKLALLMILAKPVFGYGRGDDPFMIGRTEYLAKIDFAGADLGADIGPPHNQYLYMLVQYGLVGFIAIGAIFMAIVRSGLQLMRLVPDPGSAEYQFVIIFWGMLTAYLVQGLFADVVSFPLVGSLLFLFAGILESLRLRALRYVEKPCAL